MRWTCKGEIVLSSPPDSEISLCSLSSCWIWSSMLLSIFCKLMEKKEYNHCIFCHIFCFKSMKKSFSSTIPTCCVVLNLVSTLSTSLSTAQHPSMPKQADKTAPLQSNGRGWWEGNQKFTLLYSLLCRRPPNWFETTILYLEHCKSKLFHLKGSKICNTTKKILRRRESSVSNESRQQQEEEERQLEPGKLSLLCASRARHSNFVGNQNWSRILSQLADQEIEAPQTEKDVFTIHVIFHSLGLTYLLHMN